MALLLLSGCAQMKELYRQNYCHYDGAYSKGMNDARDGKPMYEGVAYLCDEGIKSEVERGYREGYTEGSRSGIYFGSQAPMTEWKCVSAYGVQKCGYDCKAAYGKVECAREPYHNCVEGVGQVRCGLRCRYNVGDVQCDKD